MMKKFAILLLAVFIAAGLGVAVHHYMTTPRQEGVCKLKTVSSVPYLYEYDIVNFYWTSLRNPDITPELLSGIPQNIDGQKIFFSVPFRDRLLNGCLLDQGHQQYTIYADLNGNNSLSDEKPLIPQKQSYGSDDDSIFLFGPLSLTEDSSKTKPFYLFLTNFTAGIHVAPTMIKKGKIRINDNIHRVMLADLDFDGHYKTHYSPDCLKGKGFLNPAPTLCDKLLFDLDRDGEFINCYFISHENSPLPTLVQLNKQYYSLEINEKELLASPTVPQSGTLKLNTHQSSMMLWSDTYSCFIDSANTAELPIGHYSVMYAQNHFRDSNGDIWTHRLKKRSGQLLDFAISENSETSLEFPTAFTLKTELNWKDRNCGINIKLIGKHQNEYASIFQKNGTSVAEPTIHIYDKQDTVLHTGQMEYG